MKLTDSIIKAAKPRDKRYSLPDGKGLVLWVQPDGQKCWRVRFTSKYYSLTSNTEVRFRLNWYDKFP
ncbi:Arm DNA-binding domain-containing protein [Nitrosomonas sp. sh817]|uniref:Arm DNA-binding domain-containing protein n=1 Tax=Nitrosomonas sp. sh817 TaxID=3070658 RepID=UPI0035A57E89